MCTRFRVLQWLASCMYMAEVPFCQRCNSHLSVPGAGEGAHCVYSGCFHIFLVSENLFRVLLLSHDLYVPAQFLVHIAWALRWPALSHCWPPPEWDGPLPLSFLFWFIWPLLCFSSHRSLCRSVFCWYPTVFPKTVITKITDFCVGNKQTGAQLHCLPEQAWYRLQSFHCRTLCTAFVHNTGVVACELVWHIYGLFHNLQWRQVLWDTCSQIMNLADLTPLFHQAVCC